MYKILMTLNIVAAVTLGNTCLLSFSAIAEECPAAEKVVEGLKKGHEEMRKAVATATGIDAKFIAVPFGIPSDKDLTKLSKSEKPDSSSSEYTDCLYHVKETAELPSSPLVQCNLEC